MHIYYYYSKHLETSNELSYGKGGTRKLTYMDGLVGLDLKLLL